MSIPDKDENGNRRYGVWAGKPKGYSMDTTRCIEEVWPPLSVSWVSAQCARRRGYGPGGEFCKQHAKMHAPKG
jgi:hypothetical protein